MIDIYSPKLVLWSIPNGQIVLIFAAFTLNDWPLFFCYAGGDIFVFRQIPINDAVLSRYIPDERRERILSMKFLLNLYLGASVLPISSLIMQRGHEFNTLFILMIGIASTIFMAAVMLPNQVDEDTLDKPF